MTRFYQRNIGYKLVALFLAILLWMYVSNEQDPIVKQEFKNVPLTAVKLADDYLVVEMPETVTVFLQGNRSKLAGVRAKDIEAWVDASNVRLGDNTLPVQVTFSRESVSVADIRPAWVKVKVDRSSRKQVPVKISITGKPEEGLLLEPVFKPAEVTVTGPGEVLKLISQALVEVDVSAAAGPITRDFPVRLADNQGNRVTDTQVTVEPKSINVMVPIINDMPSKTVPVEAVITGEPAENYRIGLILVEPQTVQIVGPAPVLAGVTRVETVTVDISQAREDMIREVKLSLPEGVTAGSVNTVRVVIRLVKVGQQTVTGIPLQLVNVPDGIEAVSQVGQVVVQVEGPAAELSRLRAADFRAVVDLGGKPKGEHELPVQVTGPETVRVVDINPDTAVVTVREMVRPN